MKLFKQHTLVGLLSFWLLSGILFASSHREAPLIANDPLADNTDVYAFVSPDNPNTVTLIANYIPLQLPQAGPNYYQFGENVRYEIHVDNNIATNGDDIVYRFTFQKTNEDPTTFFNIRLGAQNLKTTYMVEKSTDGGNSWSTILTNGTVPPPNIGPRSIDSPIGLGNDYLSLMQQAVTTASSGEKVYCGPADDPFFVDLGGIFDLGDAPRQGGTPRDGVAGANVHTIAIQVPIESLQKDGKDVSQAANILDPDFVIGVWASASRPALRTLDGNGGESTSGNWVQVSRLGMPLTNEAVIAIGDKNEWNFRTPYNENPAHFEYFYNPELALYMDDDQFGGAVPAFSPLRIQRNSLGAFDFGNGQDGLFPLKGNPALDGTALDDSVFGTLLLPGPGKPRSVDLWPAFHTGVPNLAPYQLATGKGGNPLANGKPFVNNFLPNGGDMLRLNMAVPPTNRDDEAFSSLGLVQAAVLGLTDPTFANTDVEFIPNMDGFPNGRRLEDDVTRIELQAVSGIVLAAIGLWYDDFDPTDSTASPVTQDLLDVLTYSTGVESNDQPFMPSFPYLAAPRAGSDDCTGPVIDFTPAEVLPPTQLAAGDFTLVNADTDADIGALNDGDTINLALTPSINIRANPVAEAVGSVSFKLNGNTIRIENVTPYAAGGDFSGDYQTLNLSEGTYTLEATSYSGSNASGDMGASFSVQFTVINEDDIQAGCDITGISSVMPLCQGDGSYRARIFFQGMGFGRKLDKVFIKVNGQDIKYYQQTIVNLGDGNYSVEGGNIIPSGADGVDVFIEAEDGCTFFLEDAFDEPDCGSQRLGRAAFSISPNPTSDFVNIHLAQTRTGSLHIQIINAVGTLITKSTINVQEAPFYRQVDISALANGIYFIQIRNEGKLYNQKLVVVK